MIRAIIVDDELSSIESLKWEIENFCDNIEIKDTFTNPKEAISAINYLKPDCVFLDIEMPKMDGFQLLKKLEFRDFDLIITTAYDDYAIEAFKESAIDYLLKPVDSDDLVRAVSRIKYHKENNSLGEELKKVLLATQNNSDKKKVPLPLSGKIVFVRPEEIIYCKADGNYTEIYMINNKKEMLSKKIKSVEELINNKIFCRVHNSYLINTQYISEFIKSDGQYLILENKVKIPVARSKKEKLFKLLNI